AVAEAAVRESTPTVVAAAGIGARTAAIACIAIACHTNVRRIPAIVRTAQARHAPAQRGHPRGQRRKLARRELGCRGTLRGQLFRRCPAQCEPEAFGVQAEAEL